MGYEFRLLDNLDHLTRGQVRQSLHGLFGAGAANRFFDQSLGDDVQLDVLGLTDVDQPAESLPIAWSMTDRLTNTRCRLRAVRGVSDNRHAGADDRRRCVAFGAGEHGYQCGTETGPSAQR